MQNSKLMITLLLLLSFPASAFGTCYRLSLDGTTWPRTPEVACINEADENAQHDYTVTLKTGTIFDERTIATFELDEIDVLGASFVLGINNPSNSIFNDLKVQLRFDTPDPGCETGKLLIGSTEYFFERI